MDKIKEIIDMIANTSGRIDKERIIIENKNNELLKDIFYFVYNTYIVSGLSKKKIKKKVKIQIDKELNSIQDCLNYLRKNNTGRDIDVAVIQDFISRQPEGLKELITKIVCKDLKIGATANTLNKIYGSNFIPSFEIMLADKYFEHPEKVKGEFIITQKLDGMRCVIIKDNERISIFSRQGQAIDDLIEIIEDAKQLPDNYVYDGEILLKNNKQLISKDLYRETIKVTRKDGIKKNLILNTFDMLPLNDFKQGSCKIPCVDRKELLHNTLSVLKLEHVIEVPILYKGEDKKQIIKLLDEAIARDEEGIMINISNASYECKRTKNILKVKKMQDADLKVLSIEEGDGRLKGTLGRMNVEYKGNVIGVGSGFSDEMRTEVFNNQDKYIGKIAKIQYFEETTNSKDDKVSLRFPVFLEWRFDKTEPSYY